MLSCRAVPSRLRGPVGDCSGSPSQARGAGGWIADALRNSEGSWPRKSARLACERHLRVLRQMWLSPGQVIVVAVSKNAGNELARQRRKCEQSWIKHALGTRHRLGTLSPKSQVQKRNCVMPADACCRVCRAASVNVTNQRQLSISLPSIPDSKAGVALRATARRLVPRQRGESRVPDPRAFRVPLLACPASAQRCDGLETSATHTPHSRAGLLPHCVPGSSAST